MTHRLHRRDLFRASAMGLAGWWLGSGTTARSASPNEKVNLAIIGCGGQGGENLKHLTGENIVALCDVDERSAGKAFEQFPRAKRFRDYRRLFDKLASQIDAVVVTTPDHMHAPISLAAMRLGKHVYCEKPLTWSIEEARLMAETARRHKVATQMGTQGMAMDRARFGVEALRTGVLGRIDEIHVWTDRAKGWWPQGVERPADTTPVPAELDWNLWLGVAPQRPYHQAYCPFTWRGWKDFGTGAVGDMGIHNAAMVYAGLWLGLPQSVEIVETSGLMRETFPAWSALRYEFAVPGGTIPLFWYDGGKKPPATLLGGQEPAANGAIVVGGEGTLYSVEWTGADWHLLPEEKFRGYRPPEPSETRAPGESHHEEWLRACRGGPAPFCHFSGFASALTETMLVGNLALRTGKRIVWNAEKMEAEGCPEAEPFIRRQYRAGWDVV